MKYDLTSVQIFVAVAESGNLTRAAERQHLAVSAVSKRVSELEGLVGTPLLVRLPRGVQLTPAGQSLLHHARQMLKLVDRMEQELAEYAGGVKGHIRLHAVASAVALVLPRELESFLQRYPMVHVSLEERVGLAVVRAVAEGEADLGIVAEPTPLQGLHALPYREDRLMLGVPSGHPLARRKSVRFADALAYPFVGPHADSSLARLMADGAKAAGVPLQQRIQLSGFDAMCGLVKTKLGVTLLPEGVLMPHVERGGIQAVALKEDWARRRMWIVVRDPDSLSGLTRSLIDHLLASAMA